MNFTAWEPFTYEVAGVTYTGRRRWPLDHQPPPVGSGALCRVVKKELDQGEDGVWQSTIVEWTPA